MLPISSTQNIPPIAIVKVYFYPELYTYDCYQSINYIQGPLANVSPSYQSILKPGTWTFNLRYKRSGNIALTKTLNIQPSVDTYIVDFNTYELLNNGNVYSGNSIQTLNSTFSSGIITMKTNSDSAAGFSNPVELKYYKNFNLSLKPSSISDTFKTVYAFYRFNIVSNYTRRGDYVIGHTIPSSDSNNYHTYTLDISEIDTPLYFAVSGLSTSTINRIWLSN